MSKIERIDRRAGRTGPVGAPADAQRGSCSLDGKLSAKFAGANAVELRSDRSEAPQPTPQPVELPPPAPKGSAPEPARPGKRRQRLRWVLFALLPVALLAGGYWYVVGGSVMSTDDAYVEADKVGISTDVSGIVQQVDVAENQQVP